MRTSYLLIAVMGSALLMACQQDKMQTATSGQEEVAKVAATAPATPEKVAVVEAPANVAETSVAKKVEAKSAAVVEAASAPVEPVVAAAVATPAKETAVKQVAAKVAEPAEMPAAPAVKAAPAKKVEETAKVDAKAVAKTAETSAPVVTPPPAVVAKPAGDVATGAAIAKKCVACHTFDQGGKDKTGPNLFGVVGRTQGSVAGFRYGAYLQDQAAAGAVWDSASLAAWLEDSKAVAKAAGSSSKMPAQKIDSERALHLIAYLNSLK